MKRYRTNILAKTQLSVSCLNCVRLSVVSMTRPGPRDSGGMGSPGLQYSGVPRGATRRWRDRIGPSPMLSTRSNHLLTITGPETPCPCDCRCSQRTLLKDSMLFWHLVQRKVDGDQRSELFTCLGLRTREVRHTAGTVMDRQSLADPWSRRLQESLSMSQRANRHSLPAPD